MFTRTVERLLTNDSNDKMQYCRSHGESMPSGEVLKEVVKLVRAVIFPGYFGDSTLSDYTMGYRAGVMIERIYELLCKQIEAGLSLGTTVIKNPSERAAEIALSFVDYLPQLRAELALDVEAAYNGDPAATGMAEVIFSYPGLFAITVYRLAHRLYVLNVPMIPRIMTEYAHSITGIDIHPGATIGKNFFIGNNRCKRRIRARNDVHVVVLLFEVVARAKHHAQRCRNGAIV